MRGLPLLLMLSVLLAGCAKSAAQPESVPQGTSVVENTPDEFGGGTGAVEGVVVDDAVVPIPGAVVGLGGVEGVATTDANGAFAFKGIIPGGYRLDAAALGYGSISQNVEVREGESTPITLTLVPIALIDDVYSELFIFKGYMPCGFGLVRVTVTANCPIGESWAVFTDTEVTPGIKTIFDELIWTQTSALSAAKFFMTVGKDETCNPCSYEYQYARSAAAPSPIIVRMDVGNKTCENCAEGFESITDAEDQSETFEVRHRLWVPGDDESLGTLPEQTQKDGLPIIVLEQTFEIYTTHFYGEVAPEEFTGSRPDA